MARRIILKEDSLIYGTASNPPVGYNFLGYYGNTFSQLDSNGIVTSISGSFSGGGSVLNSQMNWSNSANSFESLQITGVTGIGAMIGATGGFYFTPQSTGDVWLSYQMTTQPTNDAIYELRYGTGSAPVDGSGPVGTAVSEKLVNSTGYMFQDLSYIISGLTPFTQYWFAVYVKPVNSLLTINVFYEYMNASAIELAGVVGASGSNGTSGTSGVSGITNVDNGLEIVSGSVYLGGTFSQDTNIHAQQNSFSITNLNRLTFTASGYIKEEVVNGDFISTAYNQGNQYEVLSGFPGSTLSNIFVSKDYVSFNAFDGIFDANLTISTFDLPSADYSNDNRMVITDSTGKGLVYFDDYSSKFSTYSLVSKKYVDDVISNKTLNDVLVSGNTGSVPILLASGTHNFPAYSFENDTNTGMYNNKPNEVTIVAGGATAVIFDEWGITLGPTASTGVNHIRFNRTNTGFYNGFGGEIEIKSNGIRSLWLSNRKSIFNHDAPFSSPALNFNGDLDTGWFFAGNGQWGFSSNGSTTSVLNPFGIRLPQFTTGLLATDVNGQIVATSSLDATNGLSLNLSGTPSIGLGGTLSQNTIIYGQSYDLTINNLNSFNLTGSVVDINLDNGLFLLDTNSGNIEIYSGDITLVTNNSLNLFSTIDLSMATGTASVTTANQKGLVYTDDYSATFINNSLITKGYVDNLVSTIGSGTNGTSGTTGTSGTSGSSGTAGTSGLQGPPGETLTPLGVESSYSSLTQSKGTSYSVVPPNNLDTYIVQDTANLWIFSTYSSASNSEGWVDMGAIQGPSGLNGASGTNGTSGSSGSPGASGSSGTNGTSGILSLTGTTDNGIITLNGSSPNGTVESNLTFDGTTLNISGKIIASASTSDDLFRITQNGTGNAFVVEDSTNPDTTPFLIDSGGWVSVGSTTSITTTGGVQPKLQITDGLSGVTNSMPITTTPLVIQSDSTTSVALFSQDANISQIYFGTPADSFGAFLRWDYTNRNLILSSSNATGSIVFQTANAVEAARINQSGNFSIGTASNFAKLHVNNTGASYSFLVDDSSYPDSSPFVIDANGSVGIGTMSSTSKVIIVGTSSVLNVIGSVTNSTVFEVNGVSGQLFSINDGLTGSLFSVNDISGLPILEVFSDNTTLIGDYMAPSLYTTKKTTVGTSSTNIYSFATASYDGAFVDYTIKNGPNSRSGNLMATWNGSSIQYTESSTLDVGTTSGFTFSFAISGTYGVLRGQASTTGWTVKTIIRSI